MSLELVEKKKEDIEKFEKLQEEEKKAVEAMRGDICPHCFQSVLKFPYLNFNPIHGWLECPGCGTVFSPTSIRKLKLEKVKSLIKVPKLVIP